MAFTYAKRKAHADIFAKCTAASACGYDVRCCKRASIPPRPIRNAYRTNGGRGRLARPVIPADSANHIRSKFSEDGDLDNWVERPGVLLSSSVLGRCIKLLQNLIFDWQVFPEVFGGHA